MTRDALRSASTFVAGILLAGCATGDANDDIVVIVVERDTAVGVDQGADDVTVPDTGSPPDSGAVDSASSDDTGITDSALPVDTSVVDTGGTTDTGIADTGIADSGAPDTGAPDTGTPDTGAPDTGPTCTIALTYDFESGDQGFTHSALSSYASDDPWKRGAPSGTTIKCHGGSNCFTTGLTSNYATCQTAQLVFPTVNLSSCAGSSQKLQLSFWHYYDFEAPSSAGRYWDGGLLQVSTDGTTWADVTTSQPYDGTIKGSYAGCSPVPLVSNKSGWSGTIPGGAWKQVTFDIGAAHRVAGLRFRFLVGTDEGTNKRGWFIDDVAITSSP